MNLNELLLGKLADWRPPEGRQSLIVTDEAAGWTTTLSADRTDQIGCLVWELAMRTNAPVALALDEWARLVADRATGLLESLQVVEIDAGRGEALLRSESPATRDELVSYYEVMLNRVGSSALRRYTAPRTGPGKREQVTFALTLEAAAKLAFDLTDVR